MYRNLINPTIQNIGKNYYVISDVFDIYLFVYLYYFWPIRPRYIKTKSFSFRGLHFDFRKFD